MIKKIFIAAALVVSSVTAFAQKFGTVDTEAIFQLMPERTSAEEQLANASKTYENELTKLRENFDKEYAEFQALEENNPIRNSRMQALQELNNRIQQFYEQAQQDLARQQQTLLEPVQEKLTNAIKKVGANNGFTFIFPLGVSIYSGTDVVDCTPMVKAELGLK